MDPLSPTPNELVANSACVPARCSGGKAPGSADSRMVGGLPPPLASAGDNFIIGSHHPSIRVIVSPTFAYLGSAVALPRPHGQPNARPRWFYATARPMCWPGRGVRAGCDRAP